jgi:Galactose oxidase, central domain
MRASKYALLRFFAVFSLPFSLFSQLPPVATGTWTPANSLAAGRTASAAVVLQDGRILITGGTGASGALSSVEFFNTDGSVSPGPGMQDARANHTTVLLQDGRVLVAGGTTVGGAVTSTAEIYDPSANSWTLVAGGMTVARSGHTASLLSDGRVLIAGGQTASGATNTLELFSPATNIFSLVTAATLSSAKMQHAAAVLADGRVLIFSIRRPIASRPVQACPRPAQTFRRQRCWTAQC